MTTPAPSVTRPPLRYFGGKFRLAPWILSHVPDHRGWVEPFGGGASVLLRKPRAHSELYNDLESEVVNFFEVMRSEPERLIADLELTPFASGERYAHEFADADHEEMGGILLGLKKASVLVSGYDNELYREMFKGWKCFAKDARCDNGAERVEMLWISPNMPSAQMEIRGI